MRCTRCALLPLVRPRVLQGGAQTPGWEQHRGLTHRPTRLRLPPACPSPICLLQYDTESLVRWLPKLKQAPVGWYPETLHGAGNRCLRLRRPCSKPAATKARYSAP